LGTLKVAVVPAGTAPPPVAFAPKMPAPQPMMLNNSSITNASFAQQPPANPYEAESRRLRNQAKEQLLRKDEEAGIRSYNEAAAWQDNFDLLHATRDEIRNLARGPIGTFGGDDGPSVTYNVAGKMTIPSRHDEQVVEVSKIEMTPEYFYKAV